jgi:hypothetical protein
MEVILKQIESIVANYGLNVVGAIIILIVGLWLARIFIKVSNQNDAEKRC